MALLKVIVLHVRERAVAPALIADGLLEQLYRPAEAFGPIRRAFLILRKLRYASCVIPQTQRTGKGPLSANLDRARGTSSALPIATLKRLSGLVGACELSWRAGEGGLSAPEARFVGCPVGRQRGFCGAGLQPCRGCWIMGDS